MSENGSGEMGAFLAGFVIGGLVGAAAALILAPQSGEEMRAQLADQSTQLRQKGAERAGSYVTDARQTAREQAERVREQTRIVLDQGRTRLRGEAEEDDSVTPPDVSDDAQSADSDAGETA